MPGWMSRVDRLTAVQAAGSGLALAANPKNLLPSVGTTTNLRQADPTAAEASVALVAFVVLSSVFVIMAVVYDRIGGRRARSTLEDARRWLLANYDAVMAVLSVVFGAVLVSQGLSGGD